MLQLKKIRKDLGIRMIKTEIGIDELIENIIDYDVFLPTLNFNLQREFVWDYNQKNNLILSILKGIQIPGITVIKYKQKNYKISDKTIFKIIDGKQRLSTIISFLNSEFAITFEGLGYFFKDLDIEAKRILGNFVFQITMGYEYEEGEIISDKDKIIWFEQLNFGGTAQDEKHLNNLKEKI